MIFKYADDIQSNVSGKDLTIVKKELEFDALQILRFMASNGLIFMLPITFVTLT